ncbi:MAG: prolipoprotein diacylglyceryl transferase [Marivita sp.]|uniref:prolipoprotein diacylglyceryl transferase n=1 Tax=Marivita sp. TaxID=2003365 RepID=UPI003EF43DFB
MSYGLPFPNVSPELFSISIFGMEFALRWYALAYIAGILIAWRIAVAAVKRASLWANDTPPMRPEQVEDLLTWVILGIILGGRLGFVLFYQPGYYMAHPLEIFAVWQGGMSFHGGLIGVIVAALIFCVRAGIPLRPAADMIAMAAPTGVFLGRVANFINAELWGRPTELPWGVQFPGQAAQSCGQALGEICARHPSQLYEAILEGLLLGVALLWLAFRRGTLKTPGKIAGLFIGGYGAARFFVEFFRQPDAQFVSQGNPLGLALHIGGYGVTMGQLLSIPMIVIGVYLWKTARPA